MCKETALLFYAMQSGGKLPSYVLKDIGKLPSYVLKDIGEEGDQQIVELVLMPFSYRNSCAAASHPWNCLRKRALTS